MLLVKLKNYKWFQHKGDKEPEDVPHPRGPSSPCLNTSGPVSSQRETSQEGWENRGVPDQLGVGSAPAFVGVPEPRSQIGGHLPV